MRIAKPFILPLQIFVTITNNTFFSQNSRNNKGIWGTLAAPVVAYSEKKNIRISYVNWSSRHSGREDDVDADADVDADDDVDDDVDVDVDADDDVDADAGEGEEEGGEHAQRKI